MNPKQNSGKHQSVTHYIMKMTHPEQLSWYFVSESTQTPVPALSSLLASHTTRLNHTEYDLQDPQSRPRGHTSSWRSR